jgi:two-component system OmpR family sensor kinase
MWSTRARIAAAYAGLLLVTLLAFSLAVFVARRSSGIEELAAFGIQADLAADQVLKAMANAEVTGKRLTVRDSVLTLREGSSDSVWTSIVSPRPDLPQLLAPYTGTFFLVLDDQSRLLYSSSAMRRLPTEDFDRINQQAVTLYATGRAAVIPLSVGSRMLLVARSDSAVHPNVSRVIAGNTFKPVDTLINEVEAITDGRSLHRRVPTDEADDELARLADTLNRMIGRLQTSFGALRRFTADASHELKTPLTVVRADVERAMHPSASSDERMQALEEAMQEVARMSDLVDSLLTLARADEGRFDLIREPIPLEPLVRDVYETALILGEASGVTVTLPLVEDAVVMGDSTRLRQLFLNLITNAIKYTPSGGQVEMTLSLRNNNEVGFAVRDTGVGIAAADLPHIFDRFWRADKARSRRAAADLRGTTERGGFGLGLAIAQWIAQAHGGTLTAQSRLARGSIFTVLLPVAPAGASAEAG